MLYIYREMHRGPAAHVLGPLPSRGGDLELEDVYSQCVLCENMA